MSPAANPESKRLWQFDEFLVDPVRRVLLRDGAAIAVTPKPMSILLVLLERQGQVVTKQELLQRVWPDTCVTEANLTQNVSSLRKALGERALSRRYIVTVPGQGYSFAGLAVEAGQAEEVPAEGGEPAVAGPGSGELQVPASPPSSGPPSGVRRMAAAEAVSPAPPPAPVRRTWRSWSPVVLGLTVLAGAGVLWLASRRPQPPAAPASGPRPAAPAAAAPVGPRPSVAVLGFRNLGKEDDWLAPALAEMLTTEMGAGSRVRVISGDNVVRARNALALPSGDRLEGTNLERLYSLLGADRVVVGNYLALGPAGDRRIRLDLRVLEVPGGDTVTSIVQLGTEAGLFDLVSRTGAALRQSLGLARLSESEQEEARALRPTSPDAARLYAEGLSRLRAFDPPAARDRLEEALAIEPGSVVIHSALSQAWSALGYDARAADEARKALALSSSLAREQKLAIEAHVHEASKDWSRASEIYRSLWTFFPDDVEYGLQLSRALLLDGRGADARTTLAALHRLPPPSGDDPRIDLLEARVATRLADPAGEKRAAGAAVAKGRKSGESLVVAQGLVLEGDALHAMGRPEEAIRRFEQALRLSRKAGFDWVVGMALSNLGAIRQSLGDFDGAEKAHQESLDVARRLGTGLGMASQYFNLGALHHDRGDLREALGLFEEARRWCAEIGDRMTEGRTTRMVSAILWARGDLSASMRSAEEAVTISRETGNGTDEAQALLVVGRILEARDELAEARQFDLQALEILRQRSSPGLAASALLAAAEVKARLGDLPGARRRLEVALNAKQQTRDRIGEAEVLGAMARLSYESGDLREARAFGDEQLRIARQAGARALTARGLRNQGRLELAAGHVAEAQRLLGDALRDLDAMGEELEAAAVRLDLANAALAADDPATAVSLAREAAAWYAARGLTAAEARALALLAEAWLRKGDLAAARQAASRAQAQSARSKDLELRIAVATRAARVEAAAGPAGAALAALEAAIRQAEESGFVAAAFEARLALGEIRWRQQDPRGAEILAALSREAASRGFGLVARLAAGPLPGRLPLG